MIAVYADWEGLQQPKRLGFLNSRRTRAQETFEFQYDPAALADPVLGQLVLDPKILLFGGPQYPSAPQDRFGVFSDSSPDRWGRLLMKRRLERDIRVGAQPAGTRLYETDYLLGVHDLYRVGALRYKRDDQGEFLDDSVGLAAPPFAGIRALERASRALEEDPDNVSQQGQQWLSLIHI